MPPPIPPKEFRPGQAVINRVLDHERAPSAPGSRGHAFSEGDKLVVHRQGSSLHIAAALHAFRFIVVSSSCFFPSSVPFSYFSIAVVLLYFRFVIFFFSEFYLL